MAQNAANSKSCLPCRVRHSKCDGTVPCAQCRLRNTTCTTSMQVGRTAGEEGTGPVTVATSAQSLMKHLNMKPPARVKRLLDSSNGSASESPANNPTFLHKLPISDLILIAQQQQLDLDDLETKIFAATERHAVDTEEDGSDIDVRGLGFASTADLAEQLISFYAVRNAPFYPDGQVPLDKATAISLMQRIANGIQFKHLLQTSTLVGLVDAFSYCSLFAYGTKGMHRFDLAEIFLIRSERLLKMMTQNNLVVSAPSVIKLLTIIPWYLVPLIALGHNDMLREAVVLMRSVVMPHRLAIPATALSGTYGYIAYMTRDLVQRIRWIKAIDILPSGSIPPYYDSYRVQLMASDILTQEDGLFEWERLTAGVTPPEPELTYRRTLLEHIENALAKLPVYPTYVFRHQDELKRGINAGFAGAKAITLALLGRLAEAEALAASVITSIRIKDMEWVNIVTAFSTASAMQVIIACGRTDLYVPGFGLLNAVIPEVPRAVRVIHRLLNRIKEMGTPFSDILKQHNTDEETFFTNWNFHSLEGPHRRFLAKAVSLNPHEMLPSYSSANDSSLNQTPSGQIADAAEAAATLASSLTSPVTTAPSNGRSSMHSLNSVRHGAALHKPSPIPPLSPVLEAAMHGPPSILNHKQSLSTPGSFASSSSDELTAQFLPALFPVPTPPVHPSTPYFTYGQLDFNPMHPQFPSSLANLPSPHPFSEDRAFLGNFISHSPLADPPHPLTLLGSHKPSKN